MNPYRTVLNFSTAYLFDLKNFILKPFLIRHAHHLAFEKSDLFFICMLRPLSHEIKIDEMEIQAAKVQLFF